MEEITSQEVYAKLLKEVETAAFQNLYKELRDAHPELRPYGGPMCLLEILGERNPDHDEKDGCLYALICAARRKDRLSTPALSLLLLTMWPTLIVITQRLRHLLAAHPDPLTEVYWSLLQELERPTYDRKWKIAANLSRNAAKRTVHALRAEWRYQDALDAIQDWASRSVEDPSELCRRLFQGRPEVSEEEKRELAQIARQLVAERVISEEESLLVIGHAIYGRSLKDIAQSQGVDYAAARQRYCRMKARVWAHFGLG